MKLKTKEWNWAEGAEQAKSKMKSIYWWNGWLALPALLRKRNGAQPKEPKAPRQALQLTLSLSARSSAVKRENEVEGSLLSLVFFFCGGLWAGPPANAPQIRDKQEKRKNQSNSISFSFTLSHSIKHNHQTRREKRPAFDWFVVCFSFSLYLLWVGWSVLGWVISFHSNKQPKEAKEELMNKS